jgi:hypothetical protein
MSVKIREGRFDRARVRIDSRSECREGLIQLVIDPESAAGVHEADLDLLIPQHPNKFRDAGHRLAER